MSESTTIGTPAEYTDDLYRVYFEVGEHGNFAEGIMKGFLLSRSRDLPDPTFSAASLRRHRHGYEVDVPLQLVPEIVRALAAQDVAIYQVVRIGKLERLDPEAPGARERAATLSKRYWFPARTYGWGWGLPTGWQGWLVYGMAAALLVAGVFVFPPVANPVRFQAYTWGVVVLLLAVCWAKGEPPRWRWGK